MTASAGIPHDLNLATYFVDRHLSEGRSGRTALLTRDGACSYAQLAELTNRAGNALRELGVRREERVLLALSDGLEFVAAWYGAQKIGAVTAEVYTFLQPKDYAYYVEYTHASVVVVDRVTVGPMREALALTDHQPALLVVGTRRRDELRGNEARFEDLVAAAPATLKAVGTTRDDIAIWKFTTGSTGRPKACVHTIASPVLSFQGYARGVLGLGDSDVVLPVPKLFFGYARDLAALFPFGVGGAGIVFPERTTPELIFDLIERHRPSILVNVPTMMRAMLDHPDAARRDMSCLRLCTAAGEALPEPLHRRWLDTFGVEVLDGLGSSEAYHIYISNRPGRARLGTLGEAVPGYDARVVDGEGRGLPDAEVGRLWVRGGAVALMYWNDRERSTQTFAGELVMSGDLAERDADGFFRYRGRADDLLKVGGIWVAPAEIEGCLTGHPDVTACAVVGVERDGLVRGCAFVVVRESASVRPDDLRAFVRSRLAPHKVPSDVVLVADLPRTGSGKIDRAALRAQVRNPAPVADGTPS